VTAHGNKASFDDDEDFREALNDRLGRPGAVVDLQALLADERDTLNDALDELIGGSPAFPPHYHHFLDAVTWARPMLRSLVLGLGGTDGEPSAQDLHVRLEVADSAAAVPIEVRRDGDVVVVTIRSLPDDGT